MRLEPGQVFTADEDACARQQRYVNGRIREGDLEELSADLVSRHEGGTPVPSPDQPPSRIGLETGAPPKKER
ncbi:MAG: hypothetical protein M3619_00635 [Myxococcota bacterium]|nr:hypothetical protein [Myxococcota bacterium]